MKRRSGLSFGCGMTVWQAHVGHVGGQQFSSLGIFSEPRILQKRGATHAIVRSCIFTFKFFLGYFCDALAQVRNGSFI